MRDSECCQGGPRSYGKCHGCQMIGATQKVASPYRTDTRAATLERERDEARNIALELWDYGKPEDFNGKPLFDGKIHALIEQWRKKR